MLRDPMRRIYRALYYVRTMHEEWEAYLLILEVVLILIGLVAFTSETVEQVRSAGWGVLGLHFWMHNSRDLAETALFALLSLSLLAREAIRIRRKRLGYDFRPVLSIRNDAGRIDFDALLRRVEAAPWGYFPCELPSGPSNTAVAEAIASASAGHLSERSFGSEDDTWFNRERDYVAEWLDVFPSCVWLLPDRSATSVRVSGYASVIVPVTSFSGRSIRRGHRATDTAEIDFGFLKHYRRNTSPEPERRFNLLAYAHLCLSHVREVDAEKLLTASVQHLAALVYGRFGAADTARRHWRFAVICEAANDRQSALLTGLGFNTLNVAALDKERAHLRPAHSFAGFPLLELVVEYGKSEGDEHHLEAERFLACVERMVRRYAELSIPDASAAE